MKNKKLFGSIMLLLAAFIWGIGFTVQSISADSLPAFTVVFFKSSGGFLLIPVAIILKQKFTKEAIVGGVISGSFLAVACFTQQMGIERSTVAKASFITALYIVFVPIIGMLMGKKIRKLVWAGVAVAALGMYFLCMNGSFSLGIGDIYLIICAVALAAQIIVIDKFADKVDPIPLSCVQSLVVCAMALAGMIFEKPSVSVIVSIWPVLAYAAVMSCAAAQTLQVVYQKDVEPTLASLLMSFESVFGVLGGFVFLNQTLSLRELFGCVLIFVAVLIAQKE